MKRSSPVVLLLLLLGLVACGGTKGPGYRTMSSEELHDALREKDFLLVNVHVPYAGHIPGTDQFIPYNAIEQNRSRLPADKDAKLVVYCMAGPMSRVAARTLVKMGYTNVIDLPEGMRGWRSRGYTIERLPNGGR